MLAFLFAAQDQPPATCTLSGSVVHSATGAPLRKVELFAERIDPHNTPSASTTTDANGNFKLVDLPPGQYRVKGRRNGFLETYFGARRADGSGTPITLEAGQEMKDLQLKMFPYGVIAGAVRDADGEPMAGVTVKLFRQTFDETGRRTIAEDDHTVTDDLGQYRMADRQPGKYFVRAEPRYDGDQAPVDHSPKSAAPPALLLPTLYPGVIDQAAARTVDLASGAHVTGIDIPMVRSRVFKVSVYATAASGLTVASVGLEPSPGFAILGTRLTGRRNSSKEDFEIRGVPPGSYTLVAGANPPPSRAETAGAFTINFFDRQYKGRVPLAVDGDMTGVRVTVGSGSEVTGHVTIQKPDPKKTGAAATPAPTADQPENVLTDDSGGFSLLLTGVMTDGTVAFMSPEGSGEVRTPINTENQTFTTGLYPGRYQVYAGTGKLIVKSIRADGVDVFADGLNIVEGSKPAIEIVLAPEGGQVSGVALDKDYKPAAGVTVLLVAEPKLRLRSDSFHETTTDQNGRYRFENIRPGDYKVFAWEDLERNSWFDPDFLKDVESKGEPVTLAANGQAAAQVHILPAR